MIGQMRVPGIGAVSGFSIPCTLRPWSVVVGGVGAVTVPSTSVPVIPVITVEVEAGGAGVVVGVVGGVISFGPAIGTEIDVPVGIVTLPVVAVPVGGIATVPVVAVCGIVTVPVVAVDVVGGAGRVMLLAVSVIG